MGSPTIFKGGNVKQLKDNLEYFTLRGGDFVRHYTNSVVNPTSTATAGNAGSILLDQSGNMYVKQDDGTTTNWREIHKDDKKLFELSGDWADETSFSSGNNASFNGGGALVGTLSTTTTDPIDGVRSFTYTTDATVSGSANDYVSINVPVPFGHRGRLLGFKLQYSWDGDSDVILKANDDSGNALDNSNVLLCNTANFSANSVKQSLVWVQPRTGTDGDSVTFGFQVQSNHGASSVLKFDLVALSHDPVDVIDATATANNFFAARLTDVATVTSQGPVNWIASANDSAVGVYDITFEAGFFTEIPSLTASPEAGGAVAYIENEATTGCTVVLRRNDNNNPIDGDFTLYAARQGSDIETDANTKYYVVDGEELVNEFAARVDNAGTITSQSFDFIDTAVNTSTGNYTVNFIAGVFSVPPALTVTLDGNSNAFAFVDSVTASQATLKFRNSSNVGVDGDFHIKASKQSSDAVPGLATAAIAGKTHEEDSYVRCENAAGFGSGPSVVVATFDTVTSEGSALTYTKDAVNGDTITINEPGLYHCMGTINELGGDHNVGFTLNESTLTGGISTIADASQPFGYTNANNNTPASISGTQEFQAGDVLRLMGSGFTANNGNRWRMIVTKVGQSPLIDAGQVKQSDSYVRVFDANGYGSTNTVIRRYNTILDNIGSAVTYADSATDGASFTINETGFYVVNNNDNTTGGGQIGISRNSGSLTTNIAAVSGAERLATGFSNTNGDDKVVSWAGILYAGDVIRPHGDGAGGGAGTRSMFSITKQGEFEKYSGTVYKDVPDLFQTKILSADFTTASAAIADLTMNNLDIGTAYRVEFQCKWSCPNSSTSALVEINNGATIVGSSLYDPSSNATANGLTFSVVTTFTATDTTVTFNTGTTISAANRFVAGNGTKAETFATLIELPNYAATTKFN